MKYCKREKYLGTIMYKKKQHRQKVEKGVDANRVCQIRTRKTKSEEVRYILLFCKRPASGLHSLAGKSLRCGVRRLLLFSGWFSGWMMGAESK